MVISFLAYMGQFLMGYEGGAIVLPSGYKLALKVAKIFVFGPKEISY